MQYAGIEHDETCYKQQSRMGCPWFMQLHDGKLYTVYYCDRCNHWKMEEGSKEVPATVAPM